MCRSKHLPDFPLWLSSSGPHLTSPCYVFLSHLSCSLSSSTLSIIFSLVWNSEFVKLPHKPHKQHVINTPVEMLTCNCWVRVFFCFFLQANSVALTLSSSFLVSPFYHYLFLFSPVSNPTPQFYLSILSSLLNHTYLTLLEGWSDLSHLWHKALFSLRTQEIKTWKTKVTHGKYPLFLTGYNVNDIPVTLVRTAGSCYRNMSPSSSSSTCSCYRDNASRVISYR